MTLIACLEIPGDIFVESAPPEAVCDRALSRIDTRPELVVSLLQDTDAVFTKLNFLMSSGPVTSAAGKCESGVCIQMS